MGDINNKKVNVRHVKEKFFVFEKEMDNSSHA